MRKLLFITLVLSVSFGLFAADFMKAQPKKQIKKIAVDNPQVSLKDRAADDEKDISYSWHLAPQPVVDSKYDYFPGAYQNRPITYQKEFTSPFGVDLGDQMVMTFQVQQNNDRYVKGYFVSNDGTNVEESSVASATQRQGYPSLAIDPNTQRTYIAFHSDVDGDGEYEMKVVTDQYAITENLSYTATSGFDNEDYGGLNGTQTDDQYIWPTMFIRKMSNGVSRIYLFGNNYKSHNPITGDDSTAAASENVMFAYADITGTDAAIPADAWTYKTFPTMNAWNMYENDNWGRFQKGIYVSENGQEVVLYGYYTEDNTRNRFNFRKQVMRVYYNNNYGEGDFQIYDKEIDLPQENPQFLDPDSDTLYYYFTTDNNLMANDSLFWDLYFGSHLMTTEDSQGRFHVMNTICPQYYSFDGTDTLGYVFYFSTKVIELIFDPNAATEEERIVYNAVYPEDKDSLGNYLDDGVFPRVSWDVDNDGERDTLRHWTWNQYFLPLWHHDLDQAFHENYFRYARTPGGEWLAAMYGEGAMNKRTHDNSLDTHPMYEKPGCQILISGDNGDHWSDPVELYNIWDTVLYENPDDPNNPDTVNFFYDQALRQQFPNEALVYWYMGDKIEKIGPTTARIPLAFYADNKYGSSIQENEDDEVDEEGGTIYYGVIDIDMSQMAHVIVANDEPDAPKYEGLGLSNYPNPFNPTTTISFSLKKDAQTNVSIYNVKGQLVKTIVDDKLEAKTHTFTWEGDNSSNKSVASGVYFIKVQSGDKTDVKKAVLMK